MDESARSVDPQYSQGLIVKHERRVWRVIQDRVRGTLKEATLAETLTHDGAVRLAKEAARAGAGLRKLIARFEKNLEPSVLEDPRYEMRVNLIQRTGPKSEADMAVEFVRADQLNDDERDMLQQLGRRGAVMVRDVERLVVNHGWVRPAQVVHAVDQAIPFQFRIHHVTFAWKKLNLHRSVTLSRLELKSSIAATTSRTVTSSTPPRSSST